MTKNTLKEDLAEVLNKHCIDTLCNTPDFILAFYLVSCIESYNSTKIYNEEWNND